MHSTPTVDLSAWIRHHVLERRVPADGDLYDSESPPLLIMKMDIEGSESVWNHWDESGRRRVDRVESPRHRADADTGSTLRRRRGTPEI